eukprot:5111116-Amphidinium_carterae.2
MDAAPVSDLGAIRFKLEGGLAQFRHYKSRNNDHLLPGISAGHVSQKAYCLKQSTEYDAMNLKPKRFT